MPRDNGPIRVLVVDDSAAARSAFRKLLSEDPGITVQGMAGDPFEAAQLMRKALPDVILLDLQLPRMDGLTFLRKIMAQHPLPVVVCSSLTKKGSQKAIKALEFGAAEVIAKPGMATSNDRCEAQIRLCDAIHAAVSSSNGHRKIAAAKPMSPGPKLTADVILPARRANPDIGFPGGQIIAIGASTGGTEALAKILRELPGDMPPIVIVQHMPEHFTRSFAERLNGLSPLEVVEACNGEKVLRGRVVIAPGNKHAILRRSGKAYRLDLVDGPYVARHRPSVDVLFRSVAQSAGNKALGVIMTGMGDDGARGLLEMRDAGADTFVQDETSSVVFGMPKEALALGASDRTVALSSIPRALQDWSKANTLGCLRNP
ncbi:protein-glutamate methylesterase/protein-glutamine glutaminase [Primorskyibacter sp. 2E233]|uniref:protein-glutamate methylesterase/protein-glutamine glutaminase n=1 Tax=Primorskyibacter sp. 2E233 TaxID=3413431 RepID=UPI003BF19B9B